LRFNDSARDVNTKSKSDFTDGFNETTSRTGFYCGEMRQNQCIGLGVMCQKNDMYCGQFLDESFAFGGYIWAGECLSSNSDNPCTACYEGSFVKTNKVGFGTCSWTMPCNANGGNSNNSHLEAVSATSGRLDGCNAKNNLLSWNTNITLTGSESYTYVGSWEKNYMQGLGSYHTATCDYHGEWKQSQKNGLGIFRNTKKLSYSGSYASGLREGFGVLKVPTGTASYCNPELSSDQNLGSADAVKIHASSDDKKSRKLQTFMSLTVPGPSAGSRGVDGDTKSFNVYEGFWSHGLPEGPSRCKNAYDPKSAWSHHVWAGGKRVSVKSVVSRNANVAASDGQNNRKTIFGRRPPQLVHSQASDTTPQEGKPILKAVYDIAPPMPRNAINENIVVAN